MIVEEKVIVGTGALLVVLVGWAAWSDYRTERDHPCERYEMQPATCTAVTLNSNGTTGTTFFPCMRRECVERAP